MSRHLFRVATLAITLASPALIITTTACGKSVGNVIDDATITGRVKTALLVIASIALFVVAAKVHGRALRLERVVTFITIGLIVFVAALNILISLIMMVMEKTKDIAVLVSMGAKPSQVRRIFMFQGVLIGVVGTVFGLILGYTASVLAGHYKIISLSAEVYSIDYVPFAPRLIDGLLIASVAILISFIATLYPAHAAARVLPAEALRYE